MAMIAATEFFRNLSPKTCKNCGHEIEEMHDCYTHQCEECETEEK